MSETHTCPKDAVDELGRSPDGSRSLIYCTSCGKFFEVDQSGAREITHFDAGRRYPGARPPRFWTDAGCDACRMGVYSGSWPPPARIAARADGPAFLHRCDVCGTY